MYLGNFGCLGIVKRCSNGGFGQGNINTWRPKGVQLEKRRRRHSERLDEPLAPLEFLHRPFVAHIPATSERRAGSRHSILERPCWGSAQRVWEGSRLAVATQALGILRIPGRGRQWRRDRGDMRTHHWVEHEDALQGGPFSPTKGNSVFPPPEVFFCGFQHITRWIVIPRCLEGT